MTNLLPPSSEGPGNIPPARSRFPDLGEAPVRRGLILLAVVVLGWFAFQEWQDEAQALARAGVERFGLPFLIAGAALAGLVPLPYSTGALVVVYTFGGSPLWQTALVTAIASVLGGLTGYSAGRLLGAWRFRRLFGKAVFRVGSRIFRRFGVLATGLAVAVPVPFSAVCWLGGIFQVHLGGFLGIILCTRLARFTLLAWLGTALS